MRTLIIDDHPLYRSGLAALLAGLDPGMRVKGVSQVGEALAAVGCDGVDLVLLDMNLPGLSGLAALQEVRLMFEGATVVVVSGEEDPALVLATIDAGASGFIPKNTDPQITIQALRLVLAQGVYLPPLALAHAARASQRSALPALTGKQSEVLKGLLTGKSNKLIARELDMAEGTVKAHLSAVYGVLGVNSRAQAMCKAYELGLLR